MFSNNRNYSTIRNLTRADIAIQHVGRDVLSQPRLPVKRNEWFSTSREAHGGHVVVDHSPQAGPEEWWTGGASQICDFLLVIL